MSISKVLAIIAVFLVGTFLYLNWPKERGTLPVEPVCIAETAPQEEILPEIEVVKEEEAPPAAIEPSLSEGLKPRSSDTDLPKEVDRMSQLFQPYPPLLPIVQTVAYSSKVDWLAGRPAYLGDYASHYQTSKHFISRSLKGMGEYLSEAVSKGDRFNVFRKDKDIEFHLVLDLSRLKIWTYYFDKGTQERVLLKSYPVCVGRLDPKRPSGCLTPTGTFKLGKEVAVYKPGVMSNWRNEKQEMISIFGLRWIPFEREIADCTGSCKGLGFHGVPWKKTGNDYIENRECIGKYESGGCIRFLTEDIEELFAVVISKPAYVHIVKDFQDAKLPGKEKI